MSDPAALLAAMVDDLIERGRRSQMLEAAVVPARDYYEPWVGAMRAMLAADRGFLGVGEVARLGFRVDAAAGVLIIDPFVFETAASKVHADVGLRALTLVGHARGGLRVQLPADCAILGRCSDARAEVEGGTLPESLEGTVTLAPLPPGALTFRPTPPPADEKKVYVDWPLGAWHYLRVLELPRPIRGHHVYVDRLTDAAGGRQPALHPEGLAALREYLATRAVPVLVSRGVVETVARMERQAEAPAADAMRFEELEDTQLFMLAQ